jgi:ABC-type transporter Mla subunit MlaD
VRFSSNRSEDRGFQRRVLQAIGLSSILIAAVLIYIGITAPNGTPGRGYYTLRAQFNRADNLVSHYQVRVGGRLIGQVLDPRIEDGKAIVDMQLYKDAGPLLSDTTVRVRPRSAIGLRFVDLTPGTKGTPLPEGALIRASQTSASLPLDTALGIFDGQRRAKVKVLLGKLGAGFAGRGEDLNVSIKSGAPFLKTMASALGEVNDRPGALAGFVYGSAGTSAAADPVRHEIADMFSPSARALAPFYHQADGLRATLQAAPPTLDTLRTQLPPTQRLLAETTRFARAATVTLRLSPRALDRTSVLLRDGRKPLKDLNATLELADRAVDPTLALLNTVKPVLPSLDSALKGALPTLDELAPRGCDIKKAYFQWSEALAFGDAAGQYARLNATQFNPTQLQGLAPKVTPGVGDNPYPAPCVAETERTK